MTSLTVLDFEDRSVRSIMIDGDPWFVGKDVCLALDITDHHQALGRLDTDEVRGGCNIPTPSGAQLMKVISEPGVYRLVFTSRSEVAERFKRWLAHDVLPSLRRTGRYEAPSAADGLERLSALDVIELGQTMRTLREVRLTFGMRAARVLARRLPIPDDIANPPAEAGPDSVARFAEDVIVRTLGARIAAADLYEAYAAWCRRRRLDPVHPCAFGRRMSATGIGRIKSGGRSVYTDATVAAPPDDAPDTGGPRGQP